MSYALIFRAYPDIDHMAPLAWKLLEEGEDVHVVLSPGLRVIGDHRLEHLAHYPRLRTWDAGTRAWRRSLPWALWLLGRHRVRVVAVEWGSGLSAGWERPLSPAGFVSVLRAVARSVVRRREPRQLRLNFMVAARLLGRATICLPHGLSIKLAGAPGHDQTFPWQDRNRFAAYVLNTEHHREWFLSNAGGDPSVMQTWGSLRWAPEWAQLNRRLAPPFGWPADGRPLRVVFMVPKWGNAVDGDAVLDLVRRLQALDEVSLVVKGHPRPEDGSADPLRDDPAIDWSVVHDGTRADSVALIAAADVVVDVGSSIGIEALTQGRLLVNPSYLHGVTTLFDVVPGSCAVAATPDEVVELLRRSAAGDRPQIADDARDELLRRAVYASRPEPFDVLDTYVTNVRRLALAHDDQGDR